MKDKKLLQRLLSLPLVALMAINLFPQSMTAYALEEEGQRQPNISVNNELDYSQEKEDEYHYDKEYYSPMDVDGEHTVGGGGV